MAFFSTFDPWLKQQELTYYQDLFGDAGVKLITRSFLFSLIKIILPALFFVLLIIFILWFTEWIDSSGSALTFVWLPLTVFIIAAMVFRLGKLYIDYTMDFTIVTPEQIISYDQTFVLNRFVRTMQTSKIKTVSISKSWLIYSLFDNGDISFLSEWDQAEGEITLDWIKDPEAIKRTVLHLVDVAKKLESE